MTEEQQVEAAYREKFNKITKFDLARHNGEITIKNPATGNHRTFRIRTQREDASFAPGARILSLLTGQDNTTDYKGFAFISDDGRVIVWKKYREGDWVQFAKMIGEPEKFPSLEYLYSGTCRKCNRKLTHPDSIKSGIGPECAKQAR